MLFNEFYSPKDYLKEIVSAKSNTATLYLYFALMCNLKPLLDDWILKDKLEDFKKACKLYGLHVYAESIFFNVNSSDKKIKSSIGFEALTTTKAYGVPIDSGLEGRVHVFVSKSKKILDKGKVFGFYSLSVNGRVIPKLTIQHCRYGRYLGYPHCCIDFFSKYNDHIKYKNTLWFNYKNTKGKPNPLANPLTKDSYSYLYHMPCSFSCEETIKIANSLRNFILDKDKNYVKIIDRHINLTYLVFKEKDIYAFEGKMISENELSYKNCHYIDTQLYQPVYKKYFDEGDSIKVDEKTLGVYKGNQLIHTINKVCPEQGFLVSFSENV